MWTRYPWFCPHRDFRLRRSVAFHRFVTRVVVCGLGPANLGLEHDSVATDAAEIFDALPAVFRVVLDELVETREQALDDVWSDGLIKHCRRAHLHCSAPE
ncbi:MAG TPA: hypothetical protein VK571_07635 [Gemmatimonadaceae bacterium]|nr:hypothetical protein [Gemmatimonadaceae bacterium]